MRIMIEAVPYDCGVQLRDSPVLRQPLHVVRWAWALQTLRANGLTLGHDCLVMRGEQSRFLAFPSNASFLDFLQQAWTETCAEEAETVKILTLKATFAMMVKFWHGFNLPERIAFIQRLDEQHRPPIEAVYDDRLAWMMEWNSSDLVDSFDLIKEEYIRTKGEPFGDGLMLLPI